MAKPYNGPKLARGVSMPYRRNKGNGRWLVKAPAGHGKYWTKAFADADDFDESNGKTILNFLRGAGGCQDAGGPWHRGRRNDSADHG
jgi:hypothetical protein